MSCRARHRTRKIAAFFRFFAASRRFRSLLDSLAGHLQPMDNELKVLIRNGPHASSSCTLIKRRNYLSRLAVYTSFNCTTVSLCGRILSPPAVSVAFPTRSSSATNLSMQAQPHMYVQSLRYHIKKSGTVRVGPTKVGKHRPKGSTTLPLLLRPLLPSSAVRPDHGQICCRHPRSSTTFTNRSEQNTGDLQRFPCHLSTLVASVTNDSCPCFPSAGPLDTVGASSSPA